MTALPILSVIGDTILHSWEVLAKILASDETMGIVCDVGMSAKHQTFSYAQRLILPIGPSYTRMSSTIAESLFMIGKLFSFVPKCG